MTQPLSSTMLARVAAMREKYVEMIAGAKIWSREFVQGFEEYLAQTDHEIAADIIYDDKKLARERALPPAPRPRRKSRSCFEPQEISGEAEAAAKHPEGPAAYYAARNWDED